MSGNRLRQTIMGFILLGFCFYIISLFVRKDINLYIHPRYSWFALGMSVLAAAILLASLWISMKKPAKKTAPFGRVGFLDILVVAVLAIALLLPARTLSSDAIGRKTLNVPTYDATSSEARLNTTCPAHQASTLEGWVFQLSEFPADCFKGRPISITGFVLDANTASEPLPDGLFYLGRIFVSCCVIDSRPYALPIQVNAFPKYAKDTWLTVDGTLVEAELNGIRKLVVEPKTVTPIQDPTQPYEFYGQEQTE